MWEIGCVDETLNVFQVSVGDSVFTVKQPRIDDLPAIREALKKASEYTYLRYSSIVWKHPEGMCYLPLYVQGYLGRLYMIMMLDDTVVGFSHHRYWVLDEESKEKEGFPISVGDTLCNAELCVLDPYQRQGLGSLYGKVSHFIARHNKAAFIMGETFKEGGMLSIRLKDGWTDFGERMAEDGTMRTLIGKKLT